MKAVIFFTEVAQQYEHKNMEHMIGEKLLETGLLREYGLKLKEEPSDRRARKTIFEPAAEDPLQHHPFRQVRNAFLPVRKWELMCSSTVRQIMSGCWNGWFHRI